MFCDVAAPIGQDASDAGKLVQRFAEFVAVAVECIGGAVDESRDRWSRDLTVGPPLRSPGASVGF